MSLKMLIAMGLGTLTAAATRAAPWCSVPLPVDPARLSSVVFHLSPELDSTPQPLDHLHVQGSLPNDHGLHDASVQAERELPLMRDAALAGRAGAGDAYYQLAQRYLLAWAGAYRPDINPIDETVFDALIDTYAIVKSRLDPDQRRQVEAWLRDWANGYLSDMKHQQAAGTGNTNTINNWQSHRVKLVTMIAAAVEDDALFADARTQFFRQLDNNILPSGEVFDFGQRDALHYVIYDLEPLVQAALAARSRGEEWFTRKSANGASVESAVMWLEPYADGTKTHQEFVHSSVPFDAERAAAGMKTFHGQFDPKHAATLYWLASEFNPRFRPLAEKLQAWPPSFIALCGQ
jgi:hypothetical protein